MRGLLNHTIMFAHILHKICFMFQDHEYTSGGIEVTCAPKPLLTCELNQFDFQDYNFLLRVR